MPERVQHPTLPDWQFEEEVTEEGWYIRRGFRADSPAALPLITTQGRTATSSSQQFSIKAHEWDVRAGLRHRIERPRKRA